MKSVKVIITIFIIFGISAALSCRKKGHTGAITHVVQKIELRLGETFETEYESKYNEFQFKITHSEIDVQGNRCQLAVEHVKTGEMFTGWVSKGDYVSFAKHILGIEGLRLSDIQGETVILLLRV